MAKVYYNMQMDQKGISVNALTDKAFEFNGKRSYQDSMPYLEGESIQSRKGTMDAAVQKLLEYYGIKESDLEYSRQGN